MITLPAGFDIAQLASDFFNLAAPFAGVAVLVAVGGLIINLLRSAGEGPEE